MMRIGLFLLTNLAVLVVAGIILLPWRGWLESRQPFSDLFCVWYGGIFNLVIHVKMDG